MKLLFIVDPLAGLKPYKDSSVAMMRAAQARGHAVCAATTADLALREGRTQVQCVALDVNGSNDWYCAAPPSNMVLNDFDAVLMRTDPPVNTDYLLATQLLDVAAAQGVRVLNRPSALRDVNEKLAIFHFPQFIAPTLVSAKQQDFDAFLYAQQDIIAKPLTEMGGSGVFRITRDDPNRNVIFETLTQRGGRPIMAQRYLPEITQGDKRILIVDGEVQPWALARIPQAGDTRGNLAAGGTGRAQALSARDRDIAESVVPWAKANGIFLAGLDVIGDYLTEINITSPTGFQEIATQTGWDVATQFVIALERAD